MTTVRETVHKVSALIAHAEEPLLRRPRRRDLALAALLAVGAIAEFPFMTTPYPGLGLAAGMIWAAAVAYRRVHPLPVIVILTATAVTGDVVAALADEPVEGTVAGGLAAVVILYAMGRWAPPAIVASAAVLAIAVIPTTGFVNPANDPAWVWYLVELAVTVAAIASGLLVRSYQCLKTEQARAELAEDRNNLANDIHDSVAHHMSAIAIRAEGARQLADQTQRDEALDAIKNSASTGLADVRHLVSNMRSASTTARPLPGLGDLYQLAEDSNSASLHVDTVIDVATETIPVTVTAVAYAIVREALTNVRRHATGATQATVRARSTEGFLDLTITDNGPTPTTKPESPGFGINVMAERANSVGGNLTAGPDPTGGWLVAARLPITPRNTQ